MERIGGSRPEGVKKMRWADFYGKSCFTGMSYIGASKEKKFQLIFFW